MTSTANYIDALPYVDRQIDEPGVRTQVEKLIAAEMKRMPKPKDASTLYPDIDLFKDNELILQELERVRKGKPMDPLDLTRYQLQPPSSTEDSSATSSTTIPAAISGVSEQLPAGHDLWLQAVSNANAQLEHQDQRLLNLELLSKYGPNSWNIHNYQLEYELSQLQQQLEASRQRVLDLNKLRKRDQTEAGQTLARLEHQWAERVSASLQVNVAAASLQMELDQLKAYEARLRAELGLDKEEQLAKPV
ncbi:hypothetical protein DFQ27_009841 [Actinomortierella ambigua]|uniref:Breast carcinoma amplified sequence 2 n=1 Tax=Actinomortierella ambigua TaxID=1343610 RepID=A0A9P6PQ00_9FUNG|nr:hypothetical protein DFQ27_009841 [Actinomortierella ambigua]